VAVAWAVAEVVSAAVETSNFQATHRRTYHQIQSNIPLPLASNDASGRGFVFGDAALLKIEADETKTFRCAMHR